MKIYVRNETVTIEGYVNAVERNSKPLVERGVRFVERIAAGAFSRAIKAANDVRAFLNHDENRDLGGLSDGNLELYEDNIGLHAKLTTSDPEVVEDAKRGDLVGWSFGFRDAEGGVAQMRDEETGLPLRKVNNMILKEVSLLNRKRSPAYTGTLVTVRDDGTKEREIVNFGEAYESELDIIREDDQENNESGLENENTAQVENEAPDMSAEAGDEERAAEVETVSSEYFARYKNMIAEMKK